MPTRDGFHSINPLPVLSPSTGVLDNTPQVGAIIDHKDYDHVTYVISTGTLTDADATFTVLLEEGDAANLSDAAAVADAELLGTEALASFIFSDDDVTRKLGYIGTKRYTRLTITPAANATAAPMAAVCILGRPLLGSTPNPPA